MSELATDEQLTGLDKSFFEQVLRSYDNDPSIEVQSSVISPVTENFDFVCHSFQVDVIYSSTKHKNDNKKLFVKTFPANDETDKSLSFKKEVMLYTTILPDMEKIMETIEDSTKFAPKLIHQGLSDDRFLVFDATDCQTFDGLGIKDVEAMDAIIRKLAKFHAASLVLQENEGKLNKFKNFRVKATKEQYDILTTAMGNWGEEFHTFHVRMQGKFNEFLNEMEKARVTTFNVLCHGDFQSKNLLYRNNGLMDEDLLLISMDPSWTSPSYDLFYMLNFIPHLDLTKTHRSEFILTYYLQFGSTLRRLDYKEAVPTLLDLHMELLQCASIELFQVMTFVPSRFLNSPRADGDPSDVVQELHGNPGYREFIKEHLERHLNLGTLNF